MNSDQIKARIKLLYLKWKDRSISESELFELREWLSINEWEDMIIEPEYARSEDELKRQLLDNIRTTTRPVTARISGIYRWVAAAAVILCISLPAYRWLFNTTGHPKPAQHAELKPADVQPGTDKAILTLADGSTIVLDSISSGNFATQGNTNIIKLSEGYLAYKAVTGPGGEILYNTVSTPNGGQYQISLPDGSKVWLNAASSITFPTAFTGNRRAVKITGEVYMEITENVHQPFTVQAGPMEVQVLGTSFNINAYADEKAIKTTLLTGRVKVINNNASVVLSPSEQSVVQGGSPVVRKVDTEQEVAWRFGLFNFQDKSLQEVMRQLARWYNLDVVYEKDIPDIRFLGGMSRTEKLSSILKGLEESGVHFRLEKDRKLVVLP